MIVGNDDDVLALMVAEDRVPGEERLEIGHNPESSHNSDIRHNIDELLISSSGDLLVSGWIADADAPLSAVAIEGPTGTAVFEGENLRRRPRYDVSADLRDETSYRYGFWLYLASAQPIAEDGEPAVIRLQLGNGRAVSARLIARNVGERQLRRQALICAAVGSPHEQTIREAQSLDWLDWLTSGPEVARFIDAYGDGTGKAVGCALAGSGVSRVRPQGIGEAASGHLAWSIDTIVISEDGGLFIVGWLDDGEDPIAGLRIRGADWQASVSGAALARIRREDVEAALQRTGRHCYGFWTFLFSGERIPNRGGCRVELISLGGRTQVLDVPSLACVSSEELRSIVLTYLANSRHFGSPQVEKVGQLANGIGGQVVGFNRFISQSVIRAPHVERFVSPRGRPKASIIVCLYGKAEYLFVQAALFSGRPGIEDYEFIYVSNSPELAETLLKEARNAHRTYGQDITLVLLPANAGFGAANNVAARFARSQRILIVNPDVFPKQLDWARRHTALVESGRPGTRIFGVPLYYDDGSLMHGGMFFELDVGLSVNPDGVQSLQLSRVEHYGKGAPPVAVHFTRTRPVPAVTGAFISCERAWFETLGGFTEDYVFGHYEDADLCLKSLQRDEPVWLQDIRLWHLEGKGSVRLNAHEGGSLINRWLFSERWCDVVADGLQGQRPTHRLLQPPKPEPKPEPAPAEAERAETPTLQPGPAELQLPAPGPDGSRAPESPVGRMAAETASPEASDPLLAEPGQASRALPTHTLSRGTGRRARSRAQN
jgi:GT2 family glycosyltransferase